MSDGIVTNTLVTLLPITLWLHGICCIISRLAITQSRRNQVCPDMSYLRCFECLQRRIWSFLYSSKPFLDFKRLSVVSSKWLLLRSRQDRKIWFVRRCTCLPSKRTLSMILTHHVMFPKPCCCIWMLLSGQELFPTTVLLKGSCNCSESGYTMIRL